MRILMVTPMLPYPETASAGPLGMYGTLSVLRARHSVTLATFAGPDPVEQDAITRLCASGLDVRAIWQSAPAGLTRWKRRWRLLCGWLRGTAPLRALEFSDRRMQQLLDSLVARNSFDLIQIEDNAMAGYRYPPHLPIVLNEHEVRTAASLAPLSVGNASWPHQIARQAEWRRWRRYQRRVWRRADRVQVFTTRDAAAVNAIAPELSARVHVNPFGVWIPTAADRSREERDMVVFVGGFNHWPNVDAALWLGYEIMPLLRTRRPGIRLMIVGNQPPEAVRALAGDDIVVTGRVPAVEPYLERAAVVLAPLRLGGGMRMKVLQAMALGKAIVSTSIGAEGLRVGERLPPVVIADAAAAMADATVHLLEAATVRHELADQARAFVTHYHSWGGYAQRLEAIYADLVGQQDVRMEVGCAAIAPTER